MTSEPEDDDAEHEVEVVFIRASDLSVGTAVIGLTHHEGAVKFSGYETVKKIETDEDSCIVLIDFEDSLAVTVPLDAWAVVLVVV